ncbi:MAG: DUF3786 domain-containing protein [Desulfobacterales bacterium]|nr:DUF3786 domain-containing protein [Desulfobacterales bacterium]
MTTAYAAIVRENLKKLYTRNLGERADAMAARRQENCLELKAFGAACRIAPEGIHLDGAAEEGPRGIIISLYALHAVSVAPVLEPFKSFKEIPNSAPYAGAFANRTEQALVPAVGRLTETREKILARLEGTAAPDSVSGDLAFVVRPLPKISLCYVCYLADEEFPAGVTCLYSQNAHLFLPTDALADVGEYTTKTILDLCSAG